MGLLGGGIPWPLMALVSSILTLALYCVASAVPWYALIAQPSSTCTFTATLTWQKLNIACSDDCKKDVLRAPTCDFSENFAKKCTDDGDNCVLKASLSNLNATAAFIVLSALWSLLGAVFLIFVAVPAFASLALTPLINRFRLAFALLLASLVFALIAIIIFGAGFPGSMKKDYSQCEGPCTSLFGSGKITQPPAQFTQNLTVWASMYNSEAHWGGGAGFWLALVFALATNVPAVICSWLAHAQRIGGAGIRE